MERMKEKKELVHCQFLKRGKYEKIYQKSVVVFDGFIIL